MKHFALTISLMLLMLSSCSNSDVASVIPSKSVMVAEIDLSSVSAKAGLSVEGFQEQMERVADNPSGEGVATAVDHMVRNPLVFTLALKDEMYAFMTANYFGVVGHVRNGKIAEGLFSFLSRKGECTPLESKKGFNWTVYRKEWIVAFDDDRLLAMGPVGPSVQPELQKEMLRMLNQSSDESFASNPHFEHLSARSADVAMWAECSAMSASLYEPFAMGIGKDMNVPDLQMILSMDFAADGLVVKGQTFSDDDGLQQQIEAEDRYMHKLAGSYVTMAPSQFTLWGAMAMDGEKLLSVIRRSEMMGAMLAGVNAGIDADAVLRTVGGDACFCIKDFDDRQNPRIVFYADLKDKSSFADIGYWKESVGELGAGSSITDTGTDAYHLHTSGFDSDFGISRNRFYFVSSGCGIAPFATFQPSPLAAYANDIRRSSAFIVVSVPQLLRMQSVADAVETGKEAVPFVAKLVDVAETVVMSSSSAHGGEFRIVPKNKKENILKQILK